MTVNHAVQTVESFSSNKSISHSSDELHDKMFLRTTVPNDSVTEVASAVLSYELVPRFTYYFIPEVGCSPRENVEVALHCHFSSECN
jgi:hypothetical protein